ncbi:hypothetical protein [Neoaquamicrobium sediminum]|uniref:Uncharacterized protein n=1 Tax=Neoaquamicrobium sediminum TaxID=1849104 RepID=A0ABV3X0C3_9HYPH|nr:hypothetical protein [Mesorhizobium sediminum]NRC56636.1 hypothetical protein [Mesorhizobium sediminum]
MGNIANHAYDDRVGAAIEDSVNNAARVALARRLAVITHAMLPDGTLFEA